MGKMELEVKILDVNKEDIISKIKSLNGVLKKDCIQKLYTYDLPTIIGRYNDILTQINIDYKYDICVSKLKLLFFELDNLLKDTDKKELEKITGFNKLINIIDNIEKSKLIGILNNKKIIDFITRYTVNTKKWIRLRQTDDVVTIAIKHILAENDSRIQQMLETEMIVPSLKDGNDILEQLGYSFKSYQEKRRITYKINDFDVDIDMWPLIPTYIEVEAESKEKIEEVLNMLGYKMEDSVSCTADDIYLKYGINSLEYRELILEEEKKMDIK